jgi:hypothetical protein
VKETSSAGEGSRASQDAVPTDESKTYLPAKGPITTQSAPESEIHQASRVNTTPSPSGHEDIPSAAAGMPTAAGYGDEVVGYGSDEEVVCFTDIEEELIAHGTSSCFHQDPASTMLNIQQRRQRFHHNCPEVWRRQQI